MVFFSDCLGVCLGKLEKHFSGGEEAFLSELRH